MAIDLVKDFIDHFDVKYVLKYRCEWNLAMVVSTEYQINSCVSGY